MPDKPVHPFDVLRKVSIQFEPYVMFVQVSRIMYVCSYIYAVQTNVLNLRFQPLNIKCKIQSVFTSLHKVQNFGGGKFLVELYFWECRGISMNK